MVPENEELQRFTERLGGLSSDIRDLTTEVAHLATREWSREHVQHQLEPVLELLHRNTAILTKVEVLFDTHEAQMQALAAAEKQQLEDRSWSARAKRWAPYIGFLTAGTGLAYFIVRLVVERAIHDALSNITK